VKEDSRGIAEELKVKFIDEGTFSVVKASMQHLMVINYHSANHHFTKTSGYLFFILFLLFVKFVILSLFMKWSN
jgi:hypothetical protein